MNSFEKLKEILPKYTPEYVAKITDRVPPGMVFLPFHFAENPANRLTAAKLDPTCKIPGFKINAVRVEKMV